MNPDPIVSLRAPIQPRPMGCDVPLTTLQSRSWKSMNARGVRLSELRMAAASVRILGPLDVGALQHSIEAIVLRHESLRTRIIEVDGNPRQWVIPGSGCRAEVIDLSQRTSGDAENEGRRAIQEFFAMRVDLTTGPLFEAKLLRLSEMEHVLALAIDHIVSDGSSNTILSREIWSIYDQAVKGQPFLLPRLPIQFADYAVWQERTNDAWLRTHGAYWVDRLTCAPPIELPVDSGLIGMERPIRAALQFSLGSAVSASLRDLAKRERAPLSSVVLAVYVIVIAQWCKQKDIVLAFVSHGRSGRPELANVIGLIASFLHLRIQIGNDDTFLDVLKRVDAELYAAYGHQDHNRVPELTSVGAPELIFNWVSSSWIPIDWTRWSVKPKNERIGPLHIQQYPIEISQARSDSSLKLMAAPADTPAGIIITVWYRIDLFSRETVEKLFGRFRLVAAELTQTPHSSVSSVTLSDESNR